MYEIEATVTLLTPNELKLTADWPLRWLQASGSIEVQRKLEPEETLPGVKGLAQRSEIGVYQRNWPNLVIGDRVIVQCFLQGESRQGSTLTLPITSGPVRFAVGPPNGITSNSWRCWGEKKGDVYIACRDNFKECKVSLHASGRWRMGFTEEALKKHPNLLNENQNRAWEVWDKPPPQLPDVVIAYRLYFPTSELGVLPGQRHPDQWKRTVFIEAAPPGKMTAVTLFITIGHHELKHDSEPSIWLASLDIGEGRRAQLVAHGEPEGVIPELIEKTLCEVRNRAKQAGKEIPPAGYLYAHGHLPDGSRFVVGAKMNRAQSRERISGNPN
jgi:hypothetical protein